MEKLQYTFSAIVKVVIHQNQFCLIIQKSSLAESKPSQTLFSYELKESVRTQLTNKNKKTLKLSKTYHFSFNPLPQFPFHLDRAMLHM